MNMGNLNKLALTAQEALQQTIVIEMCIRDRHCAIAWDMERARRARRAGRRAQSARDARWCRAGNRRLLAA